MLDGTKGIIIVFKNYFVQLLPDESCTLYIQRIESIQKMKNMCAILEQVGREGEKLHCIISLSFLAVGTHPNEFIWVKIPWFFQIVKLPFDS